MHLVSGFTILQDTTGVRHWLAPYVNKALSAGTLKPHPVEVVAKGLEGIQAALDKHAKGVSGVKLAVQLE